MKFGVIALSLFAASVQCAGLGDESEPSLDSELMLTPERDGAMEAEPEMGEPIAAFSRESEQGSLLDSHGESIPDDAAYSRAKRYFLELIKRDIESSKRPPKIEVEKRKLKDSWAGNRQPIKYHRYLDDEQGKMHWPRARRYPSYETEAED